MSTVCNCHAAKGIDFTVLFYACEYLNQTICHNGRMSSDILHSVSVTKSWKQS